MTDKKEIIIDGVDVSGCQFRDNPYFSPCGGCENDDNCYYKQFQRKTAECEELEETISDFISDNRSMYCYDDRQPVTLEEMQECMEFTYNAGLKYKQALDEIEKYQKRNCETCVFNKTDKCDISCQIFVILDIISKAKDKK